MTRSSLSPDIDDRVFVVGAPRSGTTLVQSLLAAHSRMTSFTESHFFDRHFSFLPLLSLPVLSRSPAPRLREFLKENAEEPPKAAEWFEARGRSKLRVLPFAPLYTSRAALQFLRVLDELTLRRGCSGWIEKTPRHLRYIPFLQRISAPANHLRFVHVIRDGLEVVASLHAASQSWERPYDLEDCVSRWNADVGFSLTRVQATSDQFVFYEDLTTEPEATLRELLTGLGLCWEPEILDRYACDSDRLVTDEERPWKSNVGRRIRRSETTSRELEAESRRWVRRSLRSELYDLLHERAALQEEGGRAG